MQTYPNNSIKISCWKKIIELNLITEGSQLKVKYLGKGLDNVQNIPTEAEFLINKIHYSNKKILFLLEHKITNDIIVGKIKDIIEIDGMNPRRFAKSFNLSPEGNKIELGKKRGRKPKNKKYLKVN